MTDWLVKRWIDKSGQSRYTTDPYTAWVVEEKKWTKGNPALYFNLNWVTFNNYAPEDVLEYPYDDETHSEPYKKDVVDIYVPGLYNADIYYKFEIDDNANIKENQISKTGTRASDLTYYKNAEIDPLSFAALDNQGTLQLRIAKNGAVTPETETGSEVKFLVKLSDEKLTPTGVASFEIDNNENSPVEFYNLNGQRVSVENLVRGIYIKRQGNKSEKIIL